MDAPSYHSTLKEMETDLAVLSLQGTSGISKCLQAEERHYVDISLLDRFGAGVGASVKVVTFQGAVVDRIRLTTGFQSQVMPRAHIGLGQATRVERVEVRWPSGRTQSWTDSVLTTIIVSGENSAKPEVVPVYRWDVSQWPSADDSPTLPSLGLTNSSGAVPNVGAHRKPTIVNVWGPNCMACSADVSRLQNCMTRTRIGSTWSVCLWHLLRQIRTANLFRGMN